MTEQNEIRPRVALCTHVFNHIDFDTYFNHLFCMSSWSKKFELTLIGKCGLDAATARNGIVDSAIAAKCSHLFFIDGDHLFHESALDCLWENRDAAMVSGLVCKKGEGFSQICWNVNDKMQYMSLQLPLDGRCYEVHVCAFGCTLINVAKLMKLKKPYFRDTCADGINIRSDINLCNAFREAGEQIFVDTRVLVGHLGIPSIVYPQSSETLNHIKHIERSLALLKEGQAGNYYVPAGYVQ